MNIRNLIIISLLLSGNFNLKAQSMFGSTAIKLLQTKIANSNADTSRIRLLNALAIEYYYESKFDSCRIVASRALKLADSLMSTELIKNDAGYNNQIKILKVQTIAKFALGIQDSNTYKKVDTLKYALELAKETGNKDEEAAIHAILGDVYSFRNQLQLAIKSYLTSVELYRQTGNKSKQALELTGVAINERYLGNFGDALEHLMESLKISREINDSVTIAEALLAIGFTYMFVDKWEAALENQQEALGIYLKMKDSLGIARVYNDIGVVHIRAGNLDIALKNHHAALAIRLKSTDYFYTSASYGYLGQIYEDKEMYGEAIRNYEESLRFSELAGYKIRTINSYLALGNIFLKLPDYEIAMKYFHKAIDISRENDDQINEAFATMKIAEINLALGKTRKALEWLRQAENIVPKTAYIYLAEIYQGISEVYFSMGDYKNAYVNLMLLSKLKDTLAVSENLEKIATLTNRLEFENRQKLQNESHDKMLKIKQSEIKRQKTVRNFSLFGLFVVLVLAIIYFVRFIEKNKLNTALNKTLSNLNSTQAQLIHAEKMASLGELTAGIAHEIQNPLNFVNNFAEVSVDLVKEMNEEMETGNLAEAKTISGDLRQNLEKISNHGKRASSIVKGMLDHSRASSGQKTPTNINTLADEYLRLSYHGLRAKDKSFNADFKTDLDESIPKINVIPQDIGRVLLNLINNAFYACNERSRNTGTEKNRNIGNMAETRLALYQPAKEEPYKPMVSVITKKNADTIEIRIKDNGNGIPAHIKDKIFQPFFTTKPAGKGTGLGLSMSYDIITKGHGGELKVETKEGEGTMFIVQIPI